MSEIELSPDVFTADYQGRPGQRTFFIQSRSGPESVSLLVEKQQVALLAEKLREVLLLIDASDTIQSAVAARDPALALIGPAEPRFRVTTIGIGYEESGDHVVVVASTRQQVEGDDEPVETEDDEAIRFVLRRDQARAFVLHAAAVVEEGRPLCQLCGLPMDPDGHLCPASNGHHLTIV